MVFVVKFKEELVRVIRTKRLEMNAMILMDVKIDNFFSFSNFHMNMSYPKKIIGSYIPMEWLKHYPNFRYKKVNVIMGANATGKTTFGQILQDIFNFLDDRKYEDIVKDICEPNKTASFSIDLVLSGRILYRVSACFDAIHGKNYEPENIHVLVSKTKIQGKDSYDICAKRLDADLNEHDDLYTKELEKIKGLSWQFVYPDDTGDFSLAYQNELYLKVLEQTLKLLDPGIQKVERLKEVKNSLVIRMFDQDIVLQKGNLSNISHLSSGTKNGIAIAEMVAGIFTGEYKFYYCDEKFSYVHSEVEKAMLTVMIQRLQADGQLFFTTHNTDILDLPLPKHTFTFMRKDITETNAVISCVYASDFLKRNTDSLRNAYENDLFSSLPNTDDIYQLAEIME